MVYDRRLDELREKIKRIQEKEYGDKEKENDSKNENLYKEQLEIYKIGRKNKAIEFVYLDSGRKSITSPIAMYKRINEYGEYFNREKIYIDRIGEFEINISKKELEGFGKYLEYEKSIQLNKCLFLDIETTGLESGCGTIAYLIGIGYFDGASFVVRQYFLRDFDEEHALLSAINDYAGDFEYVITYNGKRFDMNVLQNRYLLNRIDFKLNELIHIDVFALFRSLYKKDRKLSLAVLEKELLNIERSDDIASFLIPEAYYKFLKEGYSELLEYVFEHNAQDIVSLAGIFLYLEEALSLKRFDDNLSGMIYFHFGKKAMEKSNIEEAQKYYEEAVKYNLNKKIINVIINDLSKIYKCRNEENKLISFMKYISEKNVGLIRNSYLRKLAIYLEKEEKDLIAAFYYGIKSIESKDNKNNEYIRRIFKKMLKELINKKGG